MVWGIADYWVSRVIWDPSDQHYHLKGMQRDINRPKLHICLSDNFKREFWKVFCCVCDLGVMPPDEYNQNVDNSVYTNTVAKYRCVWYMMHA